jgi:hypothetical protein
MMTTMEKELPVAKRPTVARLMLQVASMKQFKLAITRLTALQGHSQKVVSRKGSSRRQK